MNTNIILVGFMGTGKTSLGVALAERLGWVQVDTDHWIEEKTGMSIPEIFSLHGEQWFRDLETEALRTILSKRKQIVTTGGGAPLRNQNREMMLANGLVVALFAEVQTILQRVKQDANRPLLQGNTEERIKTLLEQRKGIYDFAHIHMQTDGRTIHDLREEILNQIIEYED